MEIIESWEDHNGRLYAIVRHTKKDQKRWHIKKYEPMWLDERVTPNELTSLGLTEDFRAAEFDTIEEAREYLIKGIRDYDTNSKIWWDLLGCKTFCW